MELSRVYRSDLLVNWEKFQQAQLLFPFYHSHTQSGTFSLFSGSETGNRLFDSRANSLVVGG